MKAFYKNLLQKFSEEATKDRYRLLGISRPQFIDIYAGQDYNPEYFEAHHYPAMLVNWTIDYKSKPPIAQVHFQLCYEQLRDTSNLGTNTNEALKFLDFIDITDQIIKEIESEHTGKPLLLSEGQKLDDTVVDVYNLVYQCNYTARAEGAINEYIKGQIDDLEQKVGLYARLLD